MSEQHSSESNFTEVGLSYVDRHLGSSAADTLAMLSTLGFDSLDALTRAAIPSTILHSKPLNIPAGLSEPAALAALRSIVGNNKPIRSFIGLGYVPSYLPTVIQRNVLENPGYYTQYTPYQVLLYIFPPKKFQRTHWHSLNIPLSHLLFLPHKQNNLNFP